MVTITGISKLYFISASPQKTQLNSVRSHIKNVTWFYEIINFISI